MINYASQMTAMSWSIGSGGSETRQYNAYGQLTQLSTGTVSETYNYSLTQNDGRVTSIARSGEEVVYQYAALQRLVRAETVGAGGWGMSWTYDGWGNRTSQGVVKGTVPVNSVSVDPATNRMQGWTYDANGNVTWTSETSWITYDASNRIKSMQFPVAESYEYDPSNKRIWKTTSSGETFTFWGGRGERIGRYAPEVQMRTIDGVAIHKFVWVKQGLEDVYFGGKRLQATDRLGSVGGGGRYYPYGEERSATAEGTDKFATYHRDATGFDYADQRYYSSKFGRFLTSDPYVASGGPAAPGSWNRYAYVSGDPVNYLDRSGLLQTQAGESGPDSDDLYGLRRLTQRLIAQAQDWFMSPEPPPPMSDLERSRTSTNVRMRPWLAGELAGLKSECKKQLDGVSSGITGVSVLGLMASMIEQTTFLDVNDPVLSNATMASLGLNVVNSSQTLGQYVASLPANVAGIAIGSTIILTSISPLRSDFSYRGVTALGWNTAGNLGTILIHEALHIFVPGGVGPTGHIGVARALGLSFPEGDDAAASDAIDRWIRQCQR